ncbi:MAG: hypothetical protein HYU86_05020 [Chloroflexi bacterium]|nr:hypothetical protein [Chloroflexota bacterium]
MTRQGFWGWLLQRLTGVLLVFFIGAHFFYLHYALEWPVTFRDVLNSPFLRVVDAGIVALVIYHALYGVRTALVNLGLGIKGERVVVPALFVLGLATTLVGFQVFWALLYSKP